mgnify:CR=1 FL=1
MRRRPMLTRDEKRLLMLILDSGIPSFPLIATTLERRGFVQDSDGLYFATALGRAVLQKESGQLH